MDTTDQQRAVQTASGTTWQAGDFLIFQLGAEVLGFTSCKVFYFSRVSGDRVWKTSHPL